MLNILNPACRPCKAAAVATDRHSAATLLALPPMKLSAARGITSQPPRRLSWVQLPQGRRQCDDAKAEFLSQWRAIKSRLGRTADGVLSPSIPSIDPYCANLRYRPFSSHRARCLQLRNCRLARGAGSQGAPLLAFRAAGLAPAKRDESDRAPAPRVQGLQPLADVPSFPAPAVSESSASRQPRCGQAHRRSQARRSTAEAYSRRRASGRRPRHRLG